MFLIKKYFLYHKVSKYIKKEVSQDFSESVLSKYISLMKLEDCESNNDDDYYCDDEDSISSIPLNKSTPSIYRVSQFVNANYSDNTFSKKLTNYMYERDITTSTIYKRSFINRKLISKICNCDTYHPSKQTVFALCIALRLNLAESEEFLNLAEYTFNHHKKYDLIIKFMLDNQVYDIVIINDILLHFNEPCFGK